jgi:hypothetical protein
MHNNKVECTLHCTFTVQFLSLSLVCIEVRDYDVLRGYRDKRRWVKYWAHLGCWISPCYDPFSLGAGFETYEPFISLIFKSFLGHSKPWILNQQIWGHDCIHTSRNSFVMWGLRFPQQCCWRFNYSGLWCCVRSVVQKVLKDSSALTYSFKQLNTFCTPWPWLWTYYHPSKRQVILTR